MFGQGSHEDDYALAHRVVGGVLRGVLQELFKHGQQRTHVVLVRKELSMKEGSSWLKVGREKIVQSYLPMCVESGEGGIQHAAPHLSMAVIEGVGHEEEEEGRDLGLVQVLRQFVESQSDATSRRERERKRCKVLLPTAGPRDPHYQGY